MATLRICSIEGCGKQHYAKGYCALHWKRWKLHGDPLADKRPKKTLCTISGCGKASQARGYCHTHYQRWKKYGDPHKGEFKPKGKCSIPGCDKPHLSRGLCGMHYERRRAKGDVNAGREYPRKPMRFIHEVAVPFDSDECLIWPFGKTGGGYGYISAEGKGVHTIVCKLVHGPSPDPSFEVAHGCGNRACCNPRHLRWSSRKGNHADKLLHGTEQRGAQHPRAKLTEQDVREIRSLSGEVTFAELSRRFGVSASVIASIHHGRTWRHLD
jgi:hypothetical protein